MRRLLLALPLPLLFCACHHHVRPPIVLENGQFEYSGGTRRPERAFEKFEQQAAHYCASHGHSVAIIDSREQMPAPRRVAVAMRFHCGEVAGPVPAVMMREPSPAGAPGGPPPGAPPPPPGSPPPPPTNPNAMQELDEEE